MTPLRNLSIRSKLTWLGMLTTSSALLIACAAFVAYDLVTFRGAMAERLSTQARIVGSNSAAAILFRDPEAADKILAALRAESQVVSAAIYGKDGRLFASYARDGKAGRPDVARLLPSAPELPDFGVDRVRVSRHVVFDGEAIGTVAIWAELREARDRAWRYLEIAAVVLLVSLAVGFLISSWPKRLISEPILELAETARVVTERKDYGVRMRPHGQDEIGRLITTFNEMLERIQERDLEVRSARDAALEASRLKSSFIANMSHEIRTPLNVILGYVAVIEEQLAADNPDDALVIDAIRRASRRLLVTVNSVLDISKIETGAFDVRPEPLDLVEVLSRNVSDLTVLARDKGLALRCEIVEPDAVVSFDEYCLSQTLTNLIDNAIKFTERGEVVVRLDRGSDGRLKIEVRDTGVGIDPRYLSELFVPFSQEDMSHTRRFEGSGLGLALAKRYLELNGAEISASSEKQNGSVFTIRLARECECAMPPAPPAERAPAPSEAFRGAASRRTAFLVEDDPDTVTFMRRTLGDYFEVVEARSADELRCRLERGPERPDIVLMDLSLKGDEDGISLTRYLRRQERWKDLPIIATTAHVFPADRERALAAGCNGFVPKPVNHRLLLATMWKFLPAANAAGAQVS